MYKNIVYLLVVLCLAAGLAGCSPPLTKNPSHGTKTTPITVAYSETADHTIQSVSQTVDVLRQDLRHPTLIPKQKQYRMYQKLVGGVLCVRMDMTVVDGVSTRAVSVITNGKDTVYVDPQKEAGAKRVSSGNTDDLATVPNGADLSKRIPDLDASLQRLSLRSFSIVESDDHKTRIADWQGSSQLESSRRLTRRTLKFDVSDQVVAEDVSVVVDDQGVERTTTVTFSYADTPAGPVLASKTTQLRTHYPYRITTSDRVLPQINSLAELPTVSEEDIQALRRDGALVYTVDPIIGDPSDPDEIIVTTETYSQITVNQTDDSLFRLVL